MYILKPIRIVHSFNNKNLISITRELIQSIMTLPNKHNYFPYRWTIIRLKLLLYDSSRVVPSLVISEDADYKENNNRVFQIAHENSGGLMDNVSVSQPRNRGFEPHTGHDSSYDTSTCWFPETDSRVI